MVGGGAVKVSHRYSQASQSMPDSKSKHLSVNACVLTTMLRYKLSKLYLDSTVGGGEGRGSRNAANASSGFVCFFALFVFVFVCSAYASASASALPLTPSHLIGPC